MAARLAVPLPRSARRQMNSPRPPAARPIEAVAFDLGGVLVQIVGSWAEAHARAGIPPHPCAEDLDFLGRRTPFADAMSRGQITPDEYYRATAEVSRGAYTVDDIRRIHAAWHWAEYPGVAAVIEAIEETGIATGALSNTSEPHWADLRGPRALFPSVARLQFAVASHLVGALKPEEAIYRALEATSGVAGAAILFFDDLPANVDAARAFGWRAERIDPRRDTAAQLMAALKRHGVLPSAPGNLPA